MKCIITNTTNNKITDVTVTGHNSLSDKCNKTFLRLCSSHFHKDY